MPNPSVVAQDKQARSAKAAPAPSQSLDGQPPEKNRNDEFRELDSELPRVRGRTQETDLRDDRRRPRDYTNRTVLSWTVRANDKEQMVSATETLTGISIVPGIEVKGSWRRSLQRRRRTRGLLQAHQSCLPRAGSPEREMRRLAANGSAGQAHFIAGLV